MADEEMTTGSDEVVADAADFCSTCGNPITVEGMCSTCSKSPEDCTCTGNEEGSHVHPEGSADAAM